MNLSKNIKILLGLATGFYSVAPFLLIAFYGLWMAFMIPVFNTMDQSPAADFPFVPFFLGFFFFFIAIMLFNLLHFILLPVYMALLIKNKAGLEIVRIIIAVGVIFLPFVALPSYYLIYILPSASPEWAIEPKRAAPENLSQTLS